MATHFPNFPSFKNTVAKQCSLFIFLLLQLFAFNSFSQPYYIVVGVWVEGFNVDDQYCAGCGLTFNEQFGPFNSHGGSSFGPDGELYTLSLDNQAPYEYSNDIYRIDLPAGVTGELIMDGPSDLIQMDGLLAVGGGIFYTVASVLQENDTLYRWDANAGTIEAVGSMGYVPWSDLWMAEGEVYFIAYHIGVDVVRRIIKVDLNNPSNSVEMCSFDATWGIFGLTATPVSGLFIGTEIWVNNVQIVTVNVHDCTITEMCEIGGVAGAVTCSTSPYEHNLEPETIVYIDLDCNDSSGASGADFIGEPTDCQDEDGTGIIDTDPRILIDAPIASMTVKIANPVDAPDEYLNSNGVFGINVSGSGSTEITMTNAGPAKASDFILALNQTNYFNDAFYPTGGTRNIEVQFETTAGTMSNVAIAFVEINQLPQLVVDLGPDASICEDETYTLNAGPSGQHYQWSDGSTTQTLVVSNPGLYSVTISDNTSCPGTDEIEITVIPVINVWLEGDTAACVDGSATLEINTDAPFPITVEIDVSPGDAYVFEDIETHFEFTEYPFGVTEYIIENVIPSEPACVHILDNFQVLDVYPEYSMSVQQDLCEGDSVWLGTMWIDTAGVFPVNLISLHSCDSIVNYTISLLPVEHLFYQGITCNPDSAGNFLSYLPNQQGCDTVVHNMIQLLPSDTLIHQLFHCNSDSTGMQIQSFVNQHGCDSLIFTITSLTPLQDTTFLFSTSCDSTAVGIFHHTTTNVQGCDSLVVLTISLQPVDTTLLSGTSCIPGDIGITEQLFTTAEGCDSVVITTISPGIPDSIQLSQTSCDSASLGIFEAHFTNITGCDSLVFTTVTYSQNDSTFLFSGSCDAANVGVFTTFYINQYGCDSIVTSTISQLPASQTNLNSSTCDTASSGIFTTLLTNQFGCDSTVIETVQLLSSHHTFLSAITCNIAEGGIFLEHLTNVFGCDSLVTLEISYSPPDTTIFNSFTCFENEEGLVETLLTNQLGCDSLVQQVTQLHPLPLIEIDILSDYNGYDISCFNAQDGHIIGIPVGEGPFNYSWSTQETTSAISALSEGIYQLTITDLNGCQALSEIALTGPPELIISLEVNEPDCFEQREGIVRVIPTGGVSPFVYSIDGIHFQQENQFDGLTEGTYEIVTRDANECEEKEIIWINVPIQVTIDLGADIQMTAFDTNIIHAIVNLPYDSLAGVEWSGLDHPVCPTCLSQAISPIITTVYEVSVINKDGCKDDDDLTAIVTIQDGIYIPNIFSPNGDQVNDMMTVYAGSSIREIKTFIIFDRWGNQVFESSHFPPGDLSGSWDGTMDGEEMNPAVFAYLVVVRFKDGTEKVVQGDITLIR